VVRHELVAQIVKAYEERGPQAKEPGPAASGK
jgi:phosphate starvation-inducible protein PhoH